MDRIRTLKLAVAMGLGIALIGLAFRGGSGVDAAGIVRGFQGETREVGDVPYVPTPENVVEVMLELADVGEDDVVYDLGCGDGRILIAAASTRGARGVGVDIDPELIEESRRNARRAGVEDRIAFRVGDLFATDVSAASVVALYLLPSVNTRLRPKLLSELSPGSRVVSHSFDMDEWRPDRRVDVEAPGPYDLGSRPHRVFLWIVPAEVTGSWRGELELPGAAAGSTGPRVHELELRQRFQDVSGRVETGDGAVVPIVEPHLRGRQLRLSFVDRIRGRTTTLRLRGTVRGDRIDGTAEVTSGPLAGEYPWTASRAGKAGAAPGER